MSRAEEVVAALAAQFGISRIGAAPESVSSWQLCARHIEALTRLIDHLRTVGEKTVNLGEELGVVSVDKAIAYAEALRHRYSDRMILLQHREHMAAIEQAVEQKVDNPEVRRELSDLVTQIGRQQQELADSIRARAAAEAGDLARLDLMKHRWEVRRAMLDREPAAVLVGGVLLVGIAMALVVAMFTHTAVPEILSSGFLLILGFFFGQNSTRAGG
ncbi:hypothetical protein [Nocardia paucivorans]|uniref:hypothetical protein n=1 Tax=Nocardia paucivorans TaxID=114259 RepID=UPI0002FF8D1D|nr:hypothetical protein [Nocardia paucivorans]